MKKGFTMIELIFVIVILGILAAVALPRLAATRDDAEIAKSISNTTLAVRDITSYYTAAGSFNEKPTSMTNVQLVKNDGSTIAKTEKTYTFYIPFKKEPCVKIELDADKSLIKVDKDQHASSGAGTEACKAILKAPGVKALIESKYEVRDETTGKIDELDGIRVGGASNIDFGNTK